MNDTDFDLALAVYDACAILGFEPEETEAFISALVKELEKQTH